MKELLATTQQMNERFETLMTENANLREQMAALADRLDRVNARADDRVNQDERINQEENIVNQQPPPRVPAAVVDGLREYVYAPPVHEPRARELRFMTFTSKDPEGWFASFERLMRTRRIENDAEKFDTLTAHIGHDVLKSLFSFIQTIGENDQYATFKRELIKKYGLSPEEKLEKLFRETSLAGRRPSEMLTEMIRHAGNELTRDMVMVMWRKHLPTSMQIQILNDANDIAVEHADKIYEIAAQEGKFPQNTMHAEPTPTQIMSEVEKLRLEMRRMMSRPPASNYAPRAPEQTRQYVSQEKKKFEQAKPSRADADRHPQELKSTGDTSRSSTAKDKSRNARSPKDLCNSHYNYGSQAKSCKEGCGRYVEFQRKQQRKETSGNA